MSAWYPNAIRKPVERYKPGGSSHQAMPNPTRVCLHTAVSSGDSLFDLFNTPGNAVAHFYVREDGVIEQYIRLDARSSANLDGNYNMISVESWDDAGRRQFWTDAQVEGVAQLLAWLHETHGIPLQRLKNSRRGHSGVGWHRMGIDGNFPGGLLRGRVAGGEKWSSSFGKICPFDRKIHGTVDDILPRARQIAEGDWLEMATEKELQELMEKVVDSRVEKIAQRTKTVLLHNSDVYPRDNSKKVTVNDVLARLFNRSSK